MRFLLFAAFNAVLTVAWAQSPDGRMTFQSLCSGCHGVDGNGGEHAPSILPSLAANNDEGITRIIRDGVPRKGMPAFKQMPETGPLRARRLCAHSATASWRPPRSSRQTTGPTYGWFRTRRPHARSHRTRVAAAHRRSAHSSVAQSRRTVPSCNDASRLAEHARPA